MQSNASLALSTDSKYKNLNLSISNDMYAMMGSQTPKNYIISPGYLRKSLDSVALTKLP